MSKIFMDVHECSEKHYIFTGKNALTQALFYDKYNRIASANEVYSFRAKLKESCSWGTPTSSFDSDKVWAEGNGVHAKMYISEKGSVILSSQNNGKSPLFEFAVLYPAGGQRMKGLLVFIKKSLARAGDYSSWWKIHKKWKPNV